MKRMTTLFINQPLSQHIGHKENFTLRHLNEVSDLQTSAHRKIPTFQCCAAQRRPKPRFGLTLSEYLKDPQDLKTQTQLPG
jgi:hypothetical protein